MDSGFVGSLLSSICFQDYDSVPLISQFQIDTIWNASHGDVSEFPPEM